MNANARSWEGPNAYPSAYVPVFQLQLVFRPLDEVYTAYHVTLGVL